MSETPILRLVGLAKRFGGLNAVDGVDLDIHDGEFFTVVGPSGSGKTTLLRMLAGMERPTGGGILLRDQEITEIPANRRPTCMVFQSLALFPHRSVGQNIEFSLKMKGVAPQVRRERCEQLMAQLRLPLDYYGKNVTQCSGGERQRVALARALAFDPEDSVLRRAALGHRLQTAQDPGKRAQGHSPGDRQDLRLHYPFA